MKAIISARLLCVLCCVGIYAVYYVRDIRRHTEHTHLDETVLRSWINQVESFPVHPKDRYAFHEMGFRAQIYAELLRHRGSQMIPEKQQLEEALWGQMPSIIQNTLRKLSAASVTTFTQRAMQAATLQNRKRQGLVTTTNRGDLRSTVELVSTLRYSLKDDIPVEIFYLGEDDMPELIKEAFTLMPGVQIIDLSFVTSVDEIMEGTWTIPSMQRDTALQAMALAVSSFDEIIYAAPGTIFLQPPREMLQETGYRETGTLFFHSLNTNQQADANRFLNFLRQQFDEARPSQHLASSSFYNFGLNKQQDHRVLVIDRTRPSVEAALLLNIWLQSEEVREHIWYAHFPECLTESIWLSFELAKAPYYFEPAYPGAVGEYDGPFDELAWEPALCPAHALHFIGRSSYASRGGRPMWVDGGLKLFPHHEKYLEVKAWSARGRWQQTNLGMCLIGADARSAESYGIGELITRHQAVDEVFSDIFQPIFDLYGVSLL